MLPTSSKQSPRDSSGQPELRSEYKGITVDDSSSCSRMLAFETRNTDFSVRQSPLRRMFYDHRLSRDFVEHLWSDPDALLRQGRLLSNRPRAQVAVVSVDEGDHPQNSRSIQGPHRIEGQSFPVTQGVLKSYSLAGWLHTLGHLLWVTRAQRCWNHGRRILAAGVSTPRPLALIEERLGPLRFRSFVLTEFTLGVPLDKFVQESSPTPTELDELADKFAAIWCKLGELRLSHGDLYPGNFLVMPDGQLQLIDLDHMCQHWFSHRLSRQRTKEWTYFQKRTLQQPIVWESFQAAVARREANDDVANRRI